MCEDKHDRLALYTLYLETAEKISDRRYRTNGWMLSVNTAIIGFYGYLKKGSVIGPDDAMIWMLAIPVTGVFVCLTWLALLSSFQKLNKAKFILLHEIEANLALPLFKREQEIYNALGRRPFSGVEGRVPWGFIGLYAILILAALF
ncbi:RipA family octameric membrane protein [Desulfovibrio inopinatus]|uniref:RipA family octameric membrane protein n=1 Tax=Desulfovibrio inopinatus TaxID=102109 RepID=UPI0003FEA971|nr:hypothetical protein [Desulfovibrio inopinatus]